MVKGAAWPEVRGDDDAGWFGDGMAVIARGNGAALRRRTSRGPGDTFGFMDADIHGRSGLSTSARF